MNRITATALLICSIMLIAVSLVLVLSNVTFAESIRIPVSHIEPIMGTRVVRVMDRPQVHHSRPAPAAKKTETNSIGLDTIIGAAAGYAVGNQYDDDKDAGRMVGALAGALVANKVVRPWTDEDDAAPHYGRHIPPARIGYTERREEYVKGYRHFFNVNGKEFSKVLKTQRDYINLTY